MQEDYADTNTGLWYGTAPFPQHPRAEEFGASQQVGITGIMKVLVIAQNTYREASRQPIYYLLLLVFGALIVLSPSLTLFTLRDASGVIREMGVASVTICCLLIALFSASNCVWQEIERRTALTVLSKPVRREEFLLGKFLGIYWAVLLSTSTTRRWTSSQ